MARTASSPPLGKKALAALQPRMDAWVSAYNTPAFIANDPVSFPHRYTDDPKAAELVGFLAALLSYGRRDKILETVENVLHRMDGDPLGFVTGYQPRRDAKAFDGFIYRFNRGEDLAFLCGRLRRVYASHGSLEAFFADSGLFQEPLNVQIASFLDRLLDGQAPASYGLKFLFAHPANGGACKRFNMFLRWMVRREGGVDLGLWRNSLQPSQLLMPLDTHVSQSARSLGLTQRRADDWQTAEEITAVFRRLCPEDPVRYDFALFGYSWAQRRENQRPEQGEHSLPSPNPL